MNKEVQFSLRKIICENDYMSYRAEERSCHVSQVVDIVLNGQSSGGVVSSAVNKISWSVT